MTGFRYVMFVGLLLVLTACQHSTPVPKQPNDGYLCVTLELIAPENATLSKAVEFTIIVKNTCDYAIELGVGADPIYEIFVTRQDGNAVWTFPDPEGEQGAILLIKTLEPQGELVYTEKWFLEDNDGDPVPSGTYEARASLDILVEKEGEPGESKIIWSEVELLTVLPTEPELPSGYQHPCVTFELTAPESVKRGEVTTLTLIAKNTCDQTIELNLGGKYPYEIYVARQDGTTVWTWPPPDGDVGAILNVEYLDPLEGLLYTREWPAQDNDDNPVASGTYGVRAGLILVLQEEGEVGESKIQWAEARSIDVLP